MRFLSNDPLLEGQPNYEYVKNNPVINSDPTGLLSMDYWITHTAIFQNVKDSQGKLLLFSPLKKRKYLNIA